MQIAAAGDRRAWSELVRRYERVLSAIARSHRLNESDTADMIQTTWLRLIEHMGDIRSPSQLGAWLTTTARREAIRLADSSRRQVPSGHEEVGATLVDDSEPDARLVRAERDRALRAALERLPPRRRVLLRLLAAEPPPSYEQVSAELDMPIGSIGPTRARALQQLEDEFRRELPLPPTLAGDMPAVA